MKLSKACSVPALPGDCTWVTLLFLSLATLSRVLMTALQLRELEDEGWSQSPLTPPPPEFKARWSSFRDYTRNLDLLF